MYCSECSHEVNKEKTKQNMRKTRMFDLEKSQFCLILSHLQLFLCSYIYNNEKQRHSLFSRQRNKFAKIKYDIIESLETFLFHNLSFLQGGSAYVWQALSLFSLIYGCVTQSVEYGSFKTGVVGSSPTTPTTPLDMASATLVDKVLMYVMV